MPTLTAPGPSRPRILIAEDETLIRMDLRSLLQGRGWDVCGEARDGREAVRLARDLEPDVTLMDVKMPLVDGIEATRLIQARRRTPVIMMTAYDRPSLLARSIVAGATSYVLKPFAEEELVATIASTPLCLDHTHPRKRRTQTSRKREIIAAAKRVFAEKGYEATSVEDVADRVGLLKGSLYHHIASKEEMLVTIVEEFLAASAATLRHASTTAGDARHKLQTFLLARRALHALDREGSAILSRSASSLPEKNARGIRRAVLDDRRFLIDTLLAGEAQCGFRLSGDQDHVTALILDLVSAPLPTGGLSPSDTAIDTAATSCASFVLAAVGTGQADQARRDRSAA
jgi:CheY-like chemotaxis protein/AcrR family transcriptional regulator